jgi:serine/alanine racemase
MASGFLFFRKLSGNPRKDSRALRKYGGKIALLYLLAIAIYLPLNVYIGGPTARG